MATKNSELDYRVAFAEQDFAAVEAAVDCHASLEGKADRTVRACCRFVGSRRDPDLITAGCRGKSGLKICVSVRPGGAVIRTGGIPFDVMDVRSEVMFAYKNIQISSTRQYVSTRSQVKINRIGKDAGEIQAAIIPDDNPLSEIHGGPAQVFSPEEIPVGIQLVDKNVVTSCARQVAGPRARVKIHGAAELTGDIYVPSCIQRNSIGGISSNSPHDVVPEKLSILIQFTD